MSPQPEVGMIVCDCRYRHVKIVSVDEDEDTVTLEGGFVCSFTHCCDLVPHSWEHPELTAVNQGE